MGDGRASGVLPLAPLMIEGKINILNEFVSQQLSSFLIYLTLRDIIGNKRIIFLVANFVDTDKAKLAILACLYCWDFVKTLLNGSFTGFII